MRREALSMRPSFGEPLPEIAVHGSGLVLRPWAAVDVPAVVDAASDPRIPSGTTVPSVPTEDACAAFIERQRGRRVSGVGWALAIVESAIGAADRTVASGHIGLWIESLRHGRAEIGYWVAPSRRGSGVASRAVDALSGWAFDSLDGLNRLSLFIAPDNAASIATAVNARYRFEAVLAGWETIGGEALDMCCYARLRV